ncbi:MAG TPA: hypothetical protein EYN61_01780 [Chromatiaceae bacterium]|nr:hypothetical protein [Chromatiaceae bacterium]
MRRIQTEFIGLVGDLFIGAKQLFVLSHFGAVFAELGQAGVVGGAQFLGVHYRVHVADGRPRSIELVVEFFQRLDEIVPGVVIQRIEQSQRLSPVFGQQGIDRGFDMFRFDAGKGW